MDNLPAHKLALIEPLIQSAGASVLNLSPYSPDFNPIELWWSQLKAFTSVLANHYQNGWRTFATALDLVNIKHFKTGLQAAVTVLHKPEYAVLRIRALETQNYPLLWQIVEPIQRAKVPKQRRPAVWAVLSEAVIQKLLEEQGVSYRQTLYTPIVVVWACNPSAWCRQKFVQGSPYGFPWVLTTVQSVQTHLGSHPIKIGDGSTTLLEVIHDQLVPLRPNGLRVVAQSQAFSQDATTRSVFKAKLVA